jgi:hypothetical protein
MHETLALDSAATSTLECRSGFAESIDAPGFTFDVTCRDADGNTKWHESMHNTVVTAGLNDILDKYFKGSSYTAAWYLGLKGSGSVSASDTMASHSGWSEVTAYSGTRPAIAFGTTSAGSNTASSITYTLTGSATIAGAFVATNNTNGGTTGTLYSAGDFPSGARSVQSGDQVTVTLTVSS